MDILSLDPGTTTGWAGLGTVSEWGIETGQVEGLINVWQLLMEMDPEVVVCEGFYYQRRDKVVLDSKEVIGIVKLWCWQNDVSYVEQPPSKMKFWDEGKVKKLGLWVPNQVHSMDALRHLLYFMTFTKGDERWLQQLSPA